MTERRTLLCPRCGAPLPAAASHEAVTCAFCGTVSTPNTPERAAAASAKASALACPRCNAPLFEGRASDVVLLGCGECAGIWLDNASAQRALKTLDRRISELAERASARALASPSKSPRVKCPSCKNEMDRTRATAGLVEVDIDVCGAHGTWFDRGELQIILAGLRVPQRPIVDVPIAPGEIPDFKAGTLTPDPVDAGLVIGGAFAVLGAILGAAASK